MLRRKGPTFFPGGHLRRSQRRDRAHDHRPVGGADRDRLHWRGRDQAPHQRPAVTADRGVRADRETPAG